MTKTQNQTLTDAEIRAIFLANGFTIKEGLTDLKPYVYEAARAVIAADRALLASQAEGQEPVRYEWRWFDTNQNTVTYGKWSAWERLKPRGLQKLADAVREMQGYIADGNRYELRALYAAPVAQQAPTQDLERANSCRTELVTLIHGLISQIENTMYAFRSDEAAIRAADGAIAHARKVVAAWNWNGPWAAQQAPQSAASVPDRNALLAAWRAPEPVYFEFDKKKLKPDGFAAYTVMQLHKAFADGVEAAAAPKEKDHG